MTSERAGAGARVGALPLRDLPEHVDAILRRLEAGATAWAGLGPGERADLLDACRARLPGIGARWVADAARARGVLPDSEQAAEEWLTGPTVTARYLRLLAGSLREQPADAARISRTAPGGRAVVDVFPASAWDRVLYAGIRCETWLLPGARPTRGAHYRSSRGGAPGSAGICLVLGAGNVDSIAPLDLLWQLCGDGRTVLCKLNPVAGWLTPILEDVFEPLVARGALAFVEGDIALGDRLCRDPRIGALHLTGSARTHDAIVWGATAEERARRRAAGRPRIDKPFTTELGNVTPVIVAPGRWDDATIEAQAQRVAAMVTHNASFNCVAAQVLVTCREWFLRETFLDAVKSALANTPARRAWYPGASGRHAAFMHACPSAEVVGQTGPGVVPWTFATDIPLDAEEPALRDESFCGVLAETTVAAGRSDDPAGFLDAAVCAVNERIAGELACTMLLDEPTKRELGVRLDDVIAELRYGIVGVNVWPGVVFGLGTPPWGAYPGNGSTAIGSGRGFVHNSPLLDHPERAVAFGAAVPRITPPWFPEFRGLATLGPRLLEFETSPGAGGLCQIAWSALRP